MPDLLNTFPAPPRGRLLALVGACLQIAPLILGIVGAAVVFHSMSAEGVNDPSSLSAGIRFTQIAGAVGLGLIVVGIVCMGVALWGYRNRERWFFFFLIVWSVASMMALSGAGQVTTAASGGQVAWWLGPWGAIPGAALLIYLILHRGEFLGPRDDESDSGEAKEPKDS